MKTREDILKELGDMTVKIKTLERECKYWEVQAKTTEIRRLRLEALLKVCTGTAP